MAGERLQKIVARAGLASRRAAEGLIADGRVRVNGRVVTELGTRVDARKDRVEVDGRRLVSEKPVYLVLNKPRGVVSTVRDPEGRPTVGELVAKVGARVFPVGRLDFHTSGVLLMTNDGEFCDALLHPRRDVPKTYVVKLSGEMPESVLQAWERGVELDDGRTRPAKVQLLRYEQGKTWLEVTLFEGRNQQIRRMGEKTGYTVMRLSRLSFAGVEGGRLRPGQYRELTVDELRTLKETYGVPKKVPRGQGMDPPAPFSPRAAASRTQAPARGRTKKVSPGPQARSDGLTRVGRPRTRRVGG